MYSDIVNCHYGEGKVAAIWRSYVLVGDHQRNFQCIF